MGGVFGVGVAVDAEHGEGSALEAIGEATEVGDRFGGMAAGSPEDEHYDLAPMVGERHRIAFERFPFNLRHDLAERDVPELVELFGGD